MHAQPAKTPPSQGWNFDNTYARLPEIFHVRVNPVPVRAPKLALFNRPLAEALGLDAQALAPQDMAEGAGAAVFSGNQLPEGAEPLAQAYAGHQFGHFTMLGDGRAILLGEQLTPAGERFDIQLKGAGQTAFSRLGDGRAALGPMLREYLISEAMHALGIPTTRSLAVVTTGENVYREDALPGAVLTRVAASHIRVGTFQYIASRGDKEALRTLADYTLRRHYPELAGAENPHLALLRAVMERQAALVAQWLHVGFIHGVMNTDNMSLCGETIDYGPCAFLDTYAPDTVFSSIDQTGRYAFGNQPHMAQWNLARLAETLLPLLHADEHKAIALAEECLLSFAETFKRRWLSGMRAKLGLFTEEDGDLDLVKGLLDCLHDLHADYTATFRDLAAATQAETPAFASADCAHWQARWQDRLNRQPQSRDDARTLMLKHNPAVIPRNFFVEQALQAAVQNGDYDPLTRLLKALEQPFEDGPDQAAYRTPPPPVTDYKTFCGT
ncbi:MAG: YdiU family protein [Proteobacteria bacterium]|nr:YdiU family protein [Pseudomonadota bacterium]